VAPLMLLDTASLYFRAFYGVPETTTAPDGTPVNAVRGLLDMIARLVRARHPGRLIACMDADWRPSFRFAAVPAYKSHRANPDGSEQVPAALGAQIPVIIEVLAAAGVVMAAADGFEADDVIGTLAARADRPVEIVTSDRDLFQLVDDSRQVLVLNVARGVSRLEVVDEAGVTGRYQIPSRGYAAFATLRGDPSDGLPGVAGVGEKTAAALVRVFGTVPAMLAAIDAGHGGFPQGSRAKLVAARQYLEAAGPVVQVRLDAPVRAVTRLQVHGPPARGAAASDPRSGDDQAAAEAPGGYLPARPSDPAALAELDARWDLGSSLGRMMSALAVRPD
jgi:5'-3' exonuclease